MNTALVLMDFQHAIIDRYADAATPVVASAGRALAAAREHGIPVVFVRVAFRDGLPEVSPRNTTFGPLKGSAQAASYVESSEATQITGLLAPRHGEPVVVKRRIGAFASDLDVVLSGMGVTDLVLAGVSTSGVVLTTLRDAADRDFGLTVLADACADHDPEVHRILTERVFPRQARVTTTDAWIEGL